MSFYLISSRLGYALSSLLCGLLIEAQLSWHYLFYSAAGTAATFGALFWLLARSKPHEHPLIGQQEIGYLAAKNTLVREAIKLDGDKKSSVSKQAAEMEMPNRTNKNGEHLEKLDQVKQKEEEVNNNNSKNNSTAPWGAILTSGPVWAFVITKFCVKMAGDTVQIELPAYLNRVMHLPARQNGIINSWNYVIFCLSCLLVGLLAKYASKRHLFGFSKTTVRKLFQCTASFGVATCLILISITICQSTPTVLLLMLFFFLTTFGTGGEAQIPLDISERYAGTIHAIGSSLAISGAIEPILVGFLLQGHAADRDRWRFVWWGASAFAFFGGLVFLIFGDATIQPFDKITLDQMSSNDLKAHDNKSFEPDSSTKTTTTTTTTATSGPAEDDAKEMTHEQNSYQESKQI